MRRGGAIARAPRACFLETHRWNLEGVYKELELKAPEVAGEGGAWSARERQVAGQGPIAMSARFRLRGVASWFLSRAMNPRPRVRRPAYRTFWWALRGCGVLSGVSGFQDARGRLVEREWQGNRSSFIRDRSLKRRRSSAASSHVFGTENPPKSYGQNSGGGR